MVIPILRPTTAMLKEIKLFSNFTIAELEQLLNLGTMTNFEAHTNIIIEGEFSWGLYIILEGMVSILKTNKLTGNTYDVSQLRAGSFFGEMSLADDSPRSATVCSLTHCDLFYISKDTFIQFLNQSSDLKLRFYTHCVNNLISRLRELDDNYVISQYQLWQNALKKEERST